MTRTNLKCICAALLTLLLASLVSGQSDRGTITGSVTDSSGAAVMGATVTIINAGTNISANVMTNSEGRFETELHSGQYLIWAYTHDDYSTPPEMWFMHVFEVQARPVRLILNRPEYYFHERDWLRDERTYSNKDWVTYQLLRTIAGYGRDKTDR